MTRGSTPTAVFTKRWLAGLRRRDDTTPAPIAEGPAWRSRAITAPTHLSPILSIFFAAIATSSLSYAGDLLRGGAAAGARGNVPGANPSSAQATSQARANAQDILSRTTQAVKAVQAMQNAARNTAVNGADNLGRNPVNGLQLPNVPNGLTPGGLVVAPGGVWQGAQLPQQSTSGGQTVVNVQQMAAQAVLTWSSFNIGKKTTLNFDQSFGGSQSSQWIAYNKVNDPSGVPSQILGSIQANGQVFVINRNGIIFGGASQVNTHALFASSLPINDNLINSGLLANPDQQFLFSGLAIPAGASGTPAFTPDAPYNSDYGDVTVQPGATLTAPTTSSHVGGRVALVGRNVTNGGTISTADGQTIIAAGRQVGFIAHPSGDPTLRGLDSYVGNADGASGTASNTGLVTAPRGDTMITGKSVLQMGVIDSSTSVTLNGRIDLLANYNAFPFQIPATGLFTMAPQSTGSVTLGPGSVARILPETSSSDTNVGNKLPLPSQVNVQGQTIRLGANSTLLAPGAATPPDPNDAGGTKPAQDIAGNALPSGVTFSAGTWAKIGTTFTLVNTSGQIFLESGATINVAGSTDVTVASSQNILSVQLRGTELADSPTQRVGVFRGTTIQIDVRRTGVYNGQFWIGTPLADASGFVGLIPHTAGELTVAGGTVSLNAGGSVVLQPGALVDVSGGYLHYKGGMVQTSRLVVGSHVVDISQATPDQVYEGFYTGRYTDFHEKWGVNNVFASPLALTGAHYEDAYDQGGDGGSLSVNAPSMALDGTMLGTTITGPHQSRTTATSSTLPGASSLKLAFQAQDSTYTTFPTFSPAPPNIVFQNGAVSSESGSLTVDAAYRLTGPRASTVVLSSDLLTKDGFGSLTIDNRDGNITIPSKVALRAAPTGTISLAGANIDVEGTVNAPSGTLTFNVYDIPTNTVNALLNVGNAPPADLSRGNFTLGSDASLSVAGLLVDDRRFTANPLTVPIAVKGGAVTINSYNTQLLPGSIIDASGGVAVSATGKRTYGDGGSITIASDRDLNFKAVLGGHLTLGAELKGYSAGGGSRSIGALSGGGNGGALSIQATSIQIGGVSSYANTLNLSPDFFNQGGFATFTLTGIGAPTDVLGQYVPAITIAPGTVIAPHARAQIAATTDTGIVMQPVDEPLGIRTPVNLTFNTGETDDGTLKVRGDFIMGTGAAILTDPKGSVQITANTAAVLGSIIAPGGTISITTSSGPNLLATLPADHPLPNLDLGPKSFLSTAGTVVLLPDRRGYRTGIVLAGGTIKVVGNIVAEAGAVLDVSGATGVLDLAPAYTNQSTPLIAALSGRVSTPQTHLPASPYRGTIIPDLPDGTSGDALPSGSFSGTAVVPTQVDSNGGKITLTGDTEMFMDATLRGAAGGPAATGGTLTVSSGKFTGGVALATTDTTLLVKQQGTTIPVPFYAPGQTAIGHAVVDANGNFVAGNGYFTVDKFTNGGFDSLVLGGTGGMVTFSGPVSITARNSLTVGDGSTIAADSTVNLQAAYVRLGTAFQTPSDQTITPFPLPFSPTYGPGRLNVSAQLIDIGNLSLQNIGRATFTALNGDIRGDGTLDVAGDIILQAGQIYPASAVSFTISASDYLLGGVTQPGSVSIVDGGRRQLPLSAAGQLNIYGSIINQGGTLRAPLGTINIGWDGTGTGPTDALTKTTVAKSVQINLTAGSVTSVSAVDPLNGSGVILPYGVNLNGTAWIDPTGKDITANLLPGKSVNISGINVADQAGSTIDVRGGGDLYSYQWVGGTGGSTDLLSWNFIGSWASGQHYSSTQIVSYNGAYWYARTASTTESLSKPPSAGTYWKQVSPSFAVIPGYQPTYAPYATYNKSPLAANAGNLGSDQGYVNDLNAAGNLGDGLTVGSSIYLGATPGLKAGTYTLLPARYALLPGAFLVTPQTSASVGTFTLTDDSTITAGYRFNTLNQSVGDPQLYTTVAVASSKVFRDRALYADYSANTFLRAESEVLGLSVPRLPSDAGSAVVSGSAGLTLQGAILGTAPAGGRGATIDISSSANIVIGGPNTTAAAGTVVLNAALLDSYGAESILIGGIRQFGTAGTTIIVNTNSLTVDNAGTPLIAPEILLVSNKSLTLAPGSELVQQGSIPQSGLFPPSSLLIGNAATPGSGDGVMVCVSDTSTTIVRAGVDTSNVPNITIGAGASITGRDITVDSTAGGTLDPTATIAGQYVNIRAGSVSIVLDNPGALQANPGIVLQGTVLSDLLGTQTLSLTGYRSIDIYGTGSIASGNFSLHTGDLRGFTNDPAGVVTIDSTSFTLDNAPGQIGLGPAGGAPVQGSLVINANVINTGANTINIDQYANVAFNATQGIVLQNTGGVSSQTNLTITTPIIVGAAQASQTITAQGGALNILSPVSGGSGADLAQAAGLGAIVNLVGQSIDEESRIYLPSGQITLRATATDVTVGGTLDVSGTAQKFFDVIRYTDGGNITLRSDNGDVHLAAGSEISVAAQAGGDNAGTLNVSVTLGEFFADGAMSGRGGAGGTNGTFTLDVLAEPSVAALDGILNAAAFTQSRNIRVRTGNVTVDGLAQASNYTLSADAGDITVALDGKIDASGVAGGTINLIASGSVILQGDGVTGAVLTVAAQDFSHAGKGGAISLEAGAETNGTYNSSAVVDIQAGSTIDLSVAANANYASTALAQAYGNFTGTLHIRAPQNIAGNGLGVNPINGNIIAPSSIIVEGYRIFDLTQVGGNLTNTGTINTTVDATGIIQIVSSGTDIFNSIKAASTNFVNNTTGLYTSLLAGNPNAAQLGSVLSIAPGVELINRGSAAPTSFTLGTSGSSSLIVPATGGSLFFPNGTPGNNQIRSTGAGTVTSATGVVTTFTANALLTLQPGSTVTLGAASTVSFASGSGGAIAVNVLPGTTVTTGAAGTTTANVNAVGSAVTLNTAGTSSLALAAGTTVVLPGGSGTATNKIQSSVPAIITSPTGVVTVLNPGAANAQNIPAGSKITLTSAGTLTYASGGSNTAFNVTLVAGSFSTSGTVGAAPATGNITLGSPTSTATSDWDLASFRFGPKSVPGILTMRTNGNLVFYNALSDGFNKGANSLFQAPLMDYNPLLPANAQSWSYRLTAGADFSAANYQAVQPVSQLAAGSGSLQLGKNYGDTKNAPPPTGTAASTIAMVSTRYQVIRTGSGDINISAGRDVQLLNQFSTIYTAGTKVPTPTVLPDGSSFALPILNANGADLGAIQQPVPSAIQYSLAGGNVTITAGGDITHLTRLGTTATTPLTPDSSKELPDNWLYRRSYVDPVTGLFGVSPNGEIASTTWWVDFTNFFEGAGALGGGNVTMVAGGNVSNVDGVIPTNARMPVGIPDSSKLVELGGGDLVVKAGNNIDAGVYYVERGTGNLTAGNNIFVDPLNNTRSPSTQNLKTPISYLPSQAWLPTTLFLGKGGFNLSARNDVLVGPVANVFMLPEGFNNTFRYKTYFSTYAADDFVNVSSLSGSVTFRNSVVTQGTAPVSILETWLLNVLGINQNAGVLSSNTIAFFQPWLRLDESNASPFATATTVLPPTLSATAFSGDINLGGLLTLTPAPSGSIDLLAKQSINGLQPNGSRTTAGKTTTFWGVTSIDLSDADPAKIPGITNPISYQAYTQSNVSAMASTDTAAIGFLTPFDNLFRESGQTSGTSSIGLDYGSIVTKQALHDSSILHANDLSPIHLYAGTGDVSGLILFSAKSADILAGRDITDIALYLQNVQYNAISVVSAGRDIVAYDTSSILRSSATATINSTATNSVSLGSDPLAGDIQINGPGTLEVLAGRNLDLGNAPISAGRTPDGTQLGIVSIGNARNPYLPFSGADIITAAGIGGPAELSNNPNLDLTTFVSEFLKSGGTGSTNDLAELGLKSSDISTLSPEEQAALAVDVFFLVLRDAGRSQTAGTAGGSAAGFAAIDKLFAGASQTGNLSLTSREIKTANGGNIQILVPNGKVTVGFNVTGAQPLDQGIITESGGAIQIFADGDVSLGTSRIFTLRGSDIVIWSSNGSIAAGSASKTVKSAPPTRVLLDPGSADVKTDLAGLATGGGIGVLATVADVPPGNVDLIAPRGAVDAGDAGIRATGNLNIAATKVLNADNIQVAGTSNGTPAVAAPSAPNITNLTAANQSQASTSSAAEEAAKRQQQQTTQEEAPTSIITVEVVGYGGGDGASSPEGGETPQ